MPQVHGPFAQADQMNIRFATEFRKYETFHNRPSLKTEASLSAGYADAVTGCNRSAKAEPWLRFRSDPASGRGQASSGLRQSRFGQLQQLLKRLLTAHQHDLGGRLTAQPFIRSEPGDDVGMRGYLSGKRVRVEDGL